MNAFAVKGWQLLLSSLFYGFAVCAKAADEPTGSTGGSTNGIRIFEIAGTVEISPAGATDWVPTTTPQPIMPASRLRTGPNSRVAIRWSDKEVLRFGALTEIEILAPQTSNEQSGLHLFRGIMSFFHRDKPGRIRVITQGAFAGIEGTEFVMAVEGSPGSERTRVWVIDGRVALTNAVGAIALNSGQGAVVEAGSRPVPIPAFEINNVLQWAFYYPGVLDLDDLPLAAEDKRALADSLNAYRQGDLLRALSNYPTGGELESDAKKVYHAALLLAVGQVEQAETALKPILTTDPSGRLGRLAGAIQRLVSTVKRRPTLAVGVPELASELLAASYFEQSVGRGEPHLLRALDFSKQAVSKSAQFGFGWARLAELEFSFGRTGKALDALNHSLALAPRNAQALTLQGFLLASQNRPRQAIDSFDRALELDSGLANPWLGRGLCRIRRGDRQGGDEDLLVAAALEPQRGVLRSYLGKAFEQAGDFKRATKELELAKSLDPNDPTSWLYAALLEQRENRINEAIRDLEKSQELNDNRSVYRSDLLLDQDRAVRSANLARLYADADLGDIAVREAGRGVMADYANYSAHVFLANSYEVERRASLSSLRFEAASFGEYLVANLLGPANGQLLVQPVTQLEYSTLFERNRLGVIANTEYFSRGAWHHSSAQYGSLNGSSYSLEAEYRAEPGERANQDVEIRQLEGKFKLDLTPDDSLYLHIVDFRSSGGDTAQRFDAQEVSRTFRFHEEQTPTVLTGYHHQWSPQSHTLLLAGRFDDTLNATDPLSIVLALDRGFGTTNGLAPVIVRNTYRSQVELYTAEVQQIAVIGRHSLIAGARGQWSDQKVADRVADPNGDFLVLLGLQNPVSVQSLRVSSSSAALYAYDYLRLSDTWEIVGGLNFTHQEIPVNTAIAPVSSDRERQDRVSPKAGIIWSPSPSSSLRASYTKSLAGSGLGQSVRLEPTQVAGLLQTFRDPVPFSLVGELDGADLETSEVLWEGRFNKTYLSVGGQRLVAERDRRQGLFLSDVNYDLPPTLGLIREEVRFQEDALELSAHQLIGDGWSFGVRYRLGYAELKRSFPEYPGLGVGGVETSTDWRGWLHTLGLNGLYRHPSGLFARAEGILFVQDRQREGNTAPGDSFWQVNFLAGYRFPKQRAEIGLGVLNILDTDYRLDPINHYADQPRSRTFYARLLINF
jgi:tetratricopeptide (TPR) repeat protein